MAIERSKDSKEQRKFGRRTVFKLGTAVFDDGRRIEGTVLDLSDGGAKIKVPDPNLLAGEFFFEIPSDDLIIRCCVAHIDGGVVGLRYLRPPRRLSWVK